MHALLTFGALDGTLVSEVPVDIVPAAVGGSGAARVITYGIIFNADDPHDHRGQPIVPDDR